MWERGYGYVDLELQWNFDESEVETKWSAVIITGQKSLEVC